LRLSTCSKTASVALLFAIAILSKIKLTAYLYVL